MLKKTKFLTVFCILFLVFFDVFIIYKIVNIKNININSTLSDSEITDFEIDPSITQADMLVNSWLSSEIAPYLIKTSDSKVETVDLTYSFESYEIDSVRNFSTTHEVIEVLWYVLAKLYNNPKIPIDYYGDLSKTRILEFSDGFAISATTDDLNTDNFYVAANGIVTKIGSQKYATLMDYEADKVSSGYGWRWDLAKIKPQPFKIEFTKPVKGINALNHDRYCRDSFGPEWFWAYGDRFLRGVDYVVESGLGDFNMAWVKNQSSSWRCGIDEVKEQPLLGNVIFLNKIKNKVNVINASSLPDWHKEREKIIKQNSVSCTAELPLTCIKRILDINKARQAEAEKAKQSAIKEAVSKKNLAICKALKYSYFYIAECQLEAIKKIDTATFDLCEKIDKLGNVKIIDDCYQFFAERDLNISACLGSDELSCIEKIITSTKNIADCDKVKENKEKGINNRPVCQMGYVKATGDYTVCEKLNNKKYCYLLAAVYHKDKKLCPDGDENCLKAVDKAIAEQSN